MEVPEVQKLTKLSIWPALGGKTKQKRRKGKGGKKNLIVAYRAALGDGDYGKEFHYHTEG